VAKANYERAKALYPSTAMGEAEWLQAFHRNPDIMWSIIGDVYDAVKTEEEKAAGIRRMGRRPARHGTSMEEVYATVFPTVYSSDPFPEALTKLLAGRSQRAFAAKIPCNQGTISRLLSGQLEPDIVMMERVAAAAKVAPYFFVEYRAQAIGQMVVKILMEQPNMSIQAMKRVRAGVSQ
jgi:hypothetical protein